MAMSNVHIGNPVVSLLTLFSLHLEQKAIQPDTFVCQEFPSSNFLQQIKLFDDIKLFNNPVGLGYVCLRVRMCAYKGVRVSACAYVCFVHALRTCEYMCIDVRACA